MTQEPPPVDSAQPREITEVWGRSQLRVRHWAFDLAKYFSLDPATILATWSLGQVVEGHWAIQTYETLREIQEERQERSLELQNPKAGAMGRWH